jgi:hypothetical protein
MIYINLSSYLYIHTHTYSERENMIGIQYRESGEIKRMLDNDTYCNIAPVYEVNTMQCTASCWIIREEVNRERVRDEGLIWLKHDIFMSEIPRQNPSWTIGIYFWIWKIYFVFMYESGRMRPVEMVLRVYEGKWWRDWI